MQVGQWVGDAIAAKVDPARTQARANVIHYYPAAGNAMSELVANGEITHY